MVSATQAEQPHWITSLATTTPRLEQGSHYDTQTQPHDNGVVTGNYGVSKGLRNYSRKKFEVIPAVPPYIVNNSASRDGFGDWQFLVKYRVSIPHVQEVFGRERKPITPIITRARTATTPSSISLPESSSDAFTSSDTRSP